MYKFGIILCIILPFLFFDWHARMVFISVGYRRRYGHGKSWNRAHKHYKNNWSFLERMLWLVLFKEPYENKYKMLAYLSYVHAFLTIVTICCSLISLNLFPNSKIWVYEFIVYNIFWISRFIYSNNIA